MKAAEIRQLTDVEMAKAVADKRKELFELRLQAKTGQVQDTSKIRQARRDIARLLTVQSQKRK